MRPPRSRPSRSPPPWARNLSCKTVIHKRQRYMYDPPPKAVAQLNLARGPLGSDWSSLRVPRDGMAAAGPPLPDSGVTTGCFRGSASVDMVFMNRARFARESLVDAMTTVAPVIVARQPILDHVEKIVGFELLTPPSAHPDEATASVLAQAIADIGLQRLVGSRPAHIDVSRDFLLTVRPLPLAPDRVVLELAGDEQLDDELRAV